MKRGWRKRSGTRGLLGVIDMFVILFVMTGVYICQNLSNGTTYVNCTSIKLSEKDKKGMRHYETKRGRIRKGGCEKEPIKNSRSEKYSLC